MFSFLKPCIDLAVLILYVSLSKLYPPGWRRFYVLEHVARVPYFSYLSILHFAQSIGLKVPLHRQFLHFKQSFNETYHLEIMKEMKGDRVFIDKVFASIAALIYFPFTAVLYVLSPASGMYLMEKVEGFAVKSYTQYLEQFGDSIQKIPAGVIAKEYFVSDMGRMELVGELSVQDIETLNMKQVIEAIKRDEEIHVHDTTRIKEELLAE